MMKIILNEQNLEFSFIIIILKKYSIIILEKITKEKNFNILFFFNEINRENNI